GLFRAERPGRLQTLEFREVLHRPSLCFYSGRTVALLLRWMDALCPANLWFAAAGQHANLALLSPLCRAGNGTCPPTHRAGATFRVALATLETPGGSVPRYQRCRRAGLLLLPSNA